MMSVSDRQRPGANTSDVDDCVWVTVQCQIHVFLVPILCNVVFFFGPPFGMTLV